jgi:hypothetical protein
MNQYSNLDQPDVSNTRKKPHVFGRELLYRSFQCKTGIKDIRDINGIEETRKIESNILFIIKLFRNNDVIKSSNVIENNKKNRFNHKNFSLNQLFLSIFGPLIIF